MLKDLLAKKKTLSVTGLGYVGLPLALEFARHFRVIGFDINEERVALMRQGIDPSKELDSAAFAKTDIHFTSDPADLKQAHFHIIGVPTDIDEHRVPNLKPLLSASQSVGQALKPGDYVVYESTVYPGCTEEDCLPVLERASGLTAGQDFKLGYSPERINPGDQKHTLANILKVVAGSDAAVTADIAAVYGHIITAGVYQAASIKVAEAAKVIENTQRDINIALMNELAMIFDRMDIDTKEVLEAAGTKWNFLKFSPGLVGGHCIGVDPYYLTHKAQEVGFVPQMILSGRKTNEDIPGFIAKRLVQLLLEQRKNPLDARVLVMGLTFKENVADIRNTKVVALIKELEDYRITVDVVDAHADPREVEHEYGLQLRPAPGDDYDAVIVAVQHDAYQAMSAADFHALMNGTPILMDLKGIYPQTYGAEMTYWRL